VNRLRSFRESPELLGLPLPEMLRLEEFLLRRFGIEFRADWLEDSTVAEQCGPEVGRRFTQLQFDRAEGGGPESDQDFYALISAPPLVGLVHSMKFAFILDSMAYVSALIRELRITGPVLEVGCHAGYLSSWIAVNHGLRVQGWDHCGPAIETAVAVREALGLPATALDFLSRDIEASLTGVEPFQLIVSVDGPVTFELHSLQRLRSLMAADGLAVVVSDSALDLDAELLNRAGLQVEHSDVIGGRLPREPSGFSAKVLVVLSRGEKAELEPDWLEKAQAFWYEHFQGYANTPETPGHQKTLAWCRSRLRS